MIASLDTATVRLTASSNQKSPARLSMLPSNTRPTISSFWLNTGDPELPPTMSLVVAKFSVTFGSIAFLASSHDFGRSNGGAPVARSNAPLHVVNRVTVVPWADDQ